MCRSAAEYPPNGKRCAGANHLALNPAEYDAWRLKRNARERELYHIRKAVKLGVLEPEEHVHEDTITEAGTPVLEEPVIPVGLTAAEKKALERRNTTIEKERSRLAEISKDIYKLGDARKDVKKIMNEDISNSDERRRLGKLLESDQGELAYIDIKKQDRTFKADTTNEIARVMLEDGSIGYFKYYEGAAKTDKWGTTKEYGLTHLGAALNEVTAYKVAQVLGEGYDDLVPETVFREYKGRLGTLQREAEGSLASTDWRFADRWTEFDKDKWRKAAIFDNLIGSQDRHNSNFFITDTPPPYPVLIDNGYAFPNKEDIRINATRVASTVVSNTSSHYLKLTPAERVTLYEFKKKLENSAIADWFDLDSLMLMSRRIDKLLNEGIDDPSGWSGF